MDLFEEWLNKRDESNWVKRALTDSSYKNVDQSLKEKNNYINSDLATYGDVVIKLCYVEILLDKCEKLTKEKEKYESDEYLVRYVASRYNILEKLQYDKETKSKNNCNDYNYEKKPNKNPRKYIATAVEAMIGAIYKETNDLKPIIELLKTWMESGPKDFNESK